MEQPVLPGSVSPGQHHGASSSSCRARLRLPRTKPNLAEAGRRFGNAVASQAKKGTSSASESEDDVRSEMQPVPPLAALDTSADITQHSEKPSDHSAGCDDQISFDADACTDGPVQTMQSPTSTKQLHTSVSVAALAKPCENKVSVPGEEKEEAPVCRRSKKDCEKISKEQMTMFDLIYWNPSANPMLYDDEESRVPLSDQQTSISDPSASCERLAGEDVDNPAEVEDRGAAEEEKAACDDDDDDAMPVPQVKIGPDGSIILDERSLVIETTLSKTNLSGSPVIYEHSTNTTYASFRKNKQTKTWTEKETAKFFMALSSVGTDFSLMGNLFPARSRHELKLKFKREERMNKVLVDRAINDPQQFDFSAIDDNDEIENELCAAVAVAKARCRKRSRSSTQRDENSKEKNVGRQANRRRAEQQSGKKCNKRRRDMQLESDSEIEAGDSKQDGPCVAAEETFRCSSFGGGESGSVTCGDSNDVADCPGEDQPLSMDEEDDDFGNVESILKMTRSGRQPKRKSVFTIEVAKKRGYHRIKPYTNSRKRKVVANKDMQHSILVASVPDAAALNASSTTNAISAATSNSHILMVAENSGDNESQVIHLLLYSPPAQNLTSAASSVLQEHNYVAATQCAASDASTATETLQAAVVPRLSPVQSSN